MRYTDRTETVGIHDLVPDECIDNLDLMFISTTDIFQHNGIPKAIRLVTRDPGEKIIYNIDTVIDRIDDTPFKVLYSLRDSDGSDSYIMVVDDVT